MSRGTQADSARRRRRRGLAVVAAGAALVLAAASPATAHEADDEFKLGDVLAAPAPEGTGVNMTHVANLPHQVARPSVTPQNGSDIEFFRAHGKDYALAGTLRNGLQINDISEPTEPVRTAVYDCPVNQGDIQVFRQGKRVLATYTADSRIGTGNLQSQCVQEANELDFELDGSEFGTFLVDLTVPSAPRTVSFLEVAQGSHNMTVHPSGSYLYNSNSDLATNTTPDIAIFGIQDPAKPRLVQRYSLPLVPTSLGSNPHDIFFSPSGDRAYVAALSQTLILDTSDPQQPQRLPGGPAAPGAPSGGQIIDPAIQVVHQSDTVTLTRQDGSDRTLLVISDERAGAAASAECPGGGLHVYDVTGALERTPRKLGTWFIGHAGPVGPGEVCTSHVLRMHDEQALLTIAWYSQGVRALDISGLAEYEPPDGQGDTAVAHGDGVGMTEIGSYVFPDADTWSFKTNAIASDGSFYGYGNDLNRGMDVYRFTPSEARPTTPLSPVDLLGAAAGTTSPDGSDTSPAATAILPVSALALLAAGIGLRRRSRGDAPLPGAARPAPGWLTDLLPTSRPGRRAAPVALLAMTGVLVTGAGAVALTVATVDSTEGAGSTKAVTLGGFDELRGQVQAAIERSPNGSGTGYYASDNVTFHKNIREAADGVGGRVVGDKLYVTTTKDLQIYDISNPTDPVRQGTTTVDVEFENEQVPTDGRILGISGQTSSVTTQALPCTADREASRGCLLLFDVRNADAPKLVQSIKGAGDHTSTCVTVGGRTCAWMYGSSGSISDIRTALKDAAPITESRTNWLTSLHEQLREQGWTGTLPSRTHHQTEVRPGVLLTASVPQMLVSVNTEDGGSPEAPKLLAHASHLAAPDNRTRFVHSVEFPQAGSASVMLSGGETNAEPTCGQDNGAFSTFTVQSGDSAAPTFTYADTYKLVEGDYADGNTPAGGYKLGCSVHWFEQHPGFRDGGLVALSAYESGTKFLDVTEDGRISERGFFLPLDSSASAPHWAPDGRTVYVIDYLRGIDVLTFDRDVAKGGPAELQK